MAANSCGPSKRDLGNAVVSKVEEFKRTNGRLPNSLSEAGVEKDENCPCYCKTTGNTYIAWYGTTLGESDTYDSETKKWSDRSVKVCLPTGQEFRKQLSPADKQHILDGLFTVVTKTADMPASVKEAFAQITGQPAFALANPGQKFQVADVIIDASLPHRRLVFAGVRGDEWFVHYEVGGIGHGYCLLLFKVDTKNNMQFLWGGAGSRSAESLDQLRNMVATGQFQDDLQYTW
ncbi:MAG: hypothetical protein HY010_18675 [Acidobacteria bacterium]|nr:hypothetical protein [Acidobacteriota bacterium]